MEDFYLYGAGINAYSVCDFFNNSHIKGIIDRDLCLQGSNIRGIPIISLDNYIKKGDNGKVLVSAYSVQALVVEELHKRGLNNYYKSPWMQSDFFKGREDVIDYYGLNKRENIFFLYADPISVYISELLVEQGINVSFLEDEEKIIEKGVIVISTNETKEIGEKIKNQYTNVEVIMLTEVKRKDSYDYSVLKKFKNIHSGKRCFLVGNGPSVNYSDLDLLQERGEYTFGVNMVFFGFNKTKWRPSYYVMVDRIHIENYISEINAMKEVKFFRHMEYSDIRFNGESYEFHGFPTIFAEPRFSFDIEKGVYSARSVIFDALQIAVYMGFSDIYLLGVDMSMGIDYSGDDAHFYKANGNRPVVGVGNQTMTIKALKMAYEQLEPMGIRLRNATRDVWWNDVPKVDFDSLFL